MLEHLIRPLLSRWGSARFPGSQRYWEDRYAQGGTSGPGSSGRLGDFKAQILNSFVRDFEISSVIEFGCGDGHQLSLMNYPLYIGLDTSPTAVALCRARFANDQKKAFILYKPSQRCAQPFPVSADLGLSLDLYGRPLLCRAQIRHHLLNGRGNPVGAESASHPAPAMLRLDRPARPARASVPIDTQQASVLRRLQSRVVGGLLYLSEHIRRSHGQ